MADIKNIILILLMLACPALISAEVIQHCYDGDTCTTATGEKIRIACIDTPEIKGKRANNPAAAKKARDFTRSMLVSKSVRIDRITTDRYGRTVGEIFVDGKNIGELLVKNGHARIYRKYAHQCAWSK